MDDASPLPADAPEQPAARLSSIEISIGYPAAGGGASLRSGWAFEHWQWRHADEIHACAKHLADEAGGRMTSRDGDFGGQRHAISARAGSREEALALLRAAPVAFAALAAWGCGPLDGFGPEPSRGLDECAERMLGRMQALDMRRSLPEPGSGKAERPRI